MANSNNKHTGGLFAQAFGVAKKLSSTGLELVHQVAPGSIGKLKTTPDSDQTVASSTPLRSAGLGRTEQMKFENPQQMIRQHVPKVTQQLLGRHYSKVNNVASFFSPDLNNKIADYFFDKLNDFVSEQSSVDHLLKEVGVKDLTDLAQDSSRSARISHALSNQNKTFAAVQGAITGATGVIGTAIDIPLSLALTLKTIYQTGRVHGFELNREHEQVVVEYVFKQVDLGSIAEKQTLLVGLRALSNMLQTRDTQQLQTLLGSSNDFSALKTWLNNEDGTPKWGWLNALPQLSILSKLMPLAGAGIGAIYSYKLVEDANTKAQHIFSSAQQYISQHPDEKVDVLSAYEKSEALLAAATPLLTSPVTKTETPSVSEIPTATTQVDNKVITQVEIKPKSAATKTEPVSTEAGLQKLVETHVEPVEEVKTQVSLADKGQEEDLIQPLDEDDIEYSPDEEQAAGEVKASTEDETVKKAKKKTAAKPSKEN